MAALMLIGGLAQAASPASLDATLQPYLGSYSLPALAAAVARGGDVIAAGAVGTRRWGTDAPVGLNDRFHLGSDTKPMTALLAAMLVEQGKLRWETTVGEVFGKTVTEIDPAWKPVTLDLLLHNRRRAGRRPGV
jgi:CubicO group peptidase (beta-lactamase class C family)